MRDPGVLVFLATLSFPFVLTALKHQWELEGIKGFRQVVSGPMFYRTHGGIHPAVSRHHHHGGGGGNDPLFQQVKAAAVGQVDIEQGKIEIRICKGFPGLGNRTGCDHLGLFLHQQGRQAFLEDRFVFQDQNFPVL